MTQTVQDYLGNLLGSIDARAAFELAKSSDNTSMQATIKSIRKDCNHDAIAAVMLASNVNVDFMNKSERTTSRFNVYSAEKVVNVARSLAKVAVLNHYTRAIFNVALALEKSEHSLTHADAVSACSMTCKHKDAKREAIIKRARYAKHVAANTAATQSSSSINALQTFNVLIEARDASNTVTYTLNRECEAFKALESAQA